MENIMATHRLMRFLHGALFLIVSVLIAGCASGPRSPLPVPLAISIKADADINPDSRGRPSPLKVVIYELKSSAAFDSADFFSLSQNSQAVMGADLLGMEEVFLQPGERKTLYRKGCPGTMAIGVLAEFRDIDKSVWRAAIAVPEASGILSSIWGGPRAKAYQILLNHQSVKIIPL